MPSLAQLKLRASYHLAGAAYSVAGAENFAEMQLRMAWGDGLVDEMQN